MSEILIEVPEVLEAEMPVGEPNKPKKFINPEWDDTALTEFIQANADVLVNANGVVMTLSEAIKAYPGPWGPEYEGAIFAYAQALLAQRIEEAENSEEEKEVEEDASPEQKEQLIAEQVDDQTPSKNETSDTKPTEALASASENNSGDQVQTSAVAETTANVLDNPIDIISEEEATVLETSEPTVKVLQQTTPEKAFTPIPQEPTLPKTQLPEVKITAKPSGEAKPLTKSFIDPEADPTQPVVSQEAEPEPEPEPERSLLPNPDTLATPEQNYHKAEIVLEASSTVNTEPEIEVVADNLVEIKLEPETEVLIDQVEQIDLKHIEPNAFSMPMWEELEAEVKLEQQPMQEPVEAINPEQSAQINGELEEVEDMLLQLTESIEISEPEVVEELNEILDKIVKVPAMLEVAGENIISEAEAQEQLEELFTELFELAGIDYTPEIIESLAYLIISSRLTGEIEKLKKEETELASQGIGTHEIIKKLLAALGAIKNTIARANTIGKSALRLYSLSFAN